MTAAIAMPFISSAAVVAGAALGARGVREFTAIAVGSAAMAATMMAVL